MVNVSVLRPKSVSTFVNSLRAKSSRGNYYSVLKVFFEFLNPALTEVPDTLERYVRNPDKVRAIDEVSLEYVRDPEVKMMTGDVDYEEDLRRFRDEGLAGLAKSTVKYRFRVILRYLKANQIEFDDAFIKNILGRGAPVTALYEKILTPAQLDDVLDKIDPVARCPILLMAKAGMRPGETMSTKLRDLDFKFVAEFTDSETGEEVSIRIPKLNIPDAKGEQPRFTFLTKEVEEEMVKWLALRPMYIEQLKKKRWYKEGHGEVDVELIFPYGMTTLRSFWKAALKRCGRGEREPITKTKRLVYRLHNLRKFFRTYGRWRSADVAECLMGHQQGMSKIYSQPQKALEVLVKEFKEAESFLTSRKVITRDARKELNTLEQKVTRNEELLASVITKLNEKDVYIGRLERELDRLTRDEDGSRSSRRS